MLSPDAAYVPEMWAKSLTLQRVAGTNFPLLAVAFSPKAGPCPMTRLFVALSAVAAVMLSGCGPIQSTAYLLDAEVALESAQTAGADKYAPYEFTSAQLYIHKAREEVGYSDFEVAVDFAQKAARFANEAREKAMAQARDTLPPPPPPLP